MKIKHKGRLIDIPTLSNTKSSTSKPPSPITSPKSHDLPQSQNQFADLPIDTNDNDANHLQIDESHLDNVEPCGELTADGSYQQSSIKDIRTKLSLALDQCSDLYSMLSVCAQFDKNIDLGYHSTNSEKSTISV